MKTTVLCAIGLLCATGIPDRAMAQQTRFPLSDAIQLARDANPGLRAARLRADASVERIRPAGALPDPMVSLAVMNRPFTNPGSTSEPMAMNTIQVGQMFPWPGKLRFGAERARNMAAAERLEADELERWIVARVKEIYFQIAYVDRALEIMRETRDLLRNFHDVSNALYSVGTGLQQDVLQAQVAVASMTEDITVAEANRIALAARMNALLGRAPDVPIGVATLPEIEAELPSMELLMRTATEVRPAIQAAQRRVEAADAGYRAAARSVYPDLTIMFSYANRPQFEDLSSIMVGFSIPIFAASRYTPMKREMTALRLAAEAEVTDVYNETFARLAELRAEADRAQHLSRLYDSSIIPQANAAVESALSAYQVGEVDYMTLVNSEMTVNRYKIESVRLHADYLTVAAQIEALVGPSLEGKP